MSPVDAYVAAAKMLHRARKDYATARLLADVEPSDWTRYLLTQALLRLHLAYSREQRLQQRLHRRAA